MLQRLRSKLPPPRNVPVATPVPAGAPADLYAEFSHQLKHEFRDWEYGWSKHKARSCDWIARRLPDGVGVDVGGTAYLVKKVQASGRDITYFDYFPPKDDEITKHVAADMADFGHYFDEGSLDFITTRHTLEHALNPLFQLWQYNRALRLGGTLVVVVPQYSRKWVWFYSHFSCLPQESWLMLFHRAGFTVKEAAAGSWKPWNPEFIEYRFVLEAKHRGLALENPKGIASR